MKRSIVRFITLCIITLCVITGALVFIMYQRSQNPSNENQPDELSAGPATEASSTDQPSASPTMPALVPTQAVTADLLTPTEAPLEPIVLAFAGDVNLDENSHPADQYDTEKKGILGVLSQDLVDEMNSADIMMLNNEFAYSTRGTKTLDKSYTFRADPSRVEILKEMGVDIVSLANNHALDYGPDALADTFDTLDNAGIDYVGAGENLDRAKAPIYYTVGGKKIAYLAASRVVFAMNWYASKDGLGMIGTYDPTLILESIKEANANSDFVVIFVHWGIERENYPVDYQRALAKQYIDAGADVVVGCHPHVMQGVEFYKGKLIAYSLGNFLFTDKTNKSGLLKLYLDPGDSVKVQLLPTMYSGTYTYLLTDENDKEDYLDFMRNISFDVVIDEDGYITPAN